VGSSEPRSERVFCYFKESPELMTTGLLFILLKSVNGIETRTIFL